MVKQEEVLEVQKKWGEGIVQIGSLKNDPRACEEATENMIDTLYSFERGDVLFKPTKAAEAQFRLDKEGAKSYFIGGNDKFPEDQGFALMPWTNVRFENASILLEETHAVAMGNYYFTDTDGNDVKVEYTFKYYRAESGDLKIDVHHSSLPYSG